MKVLILLMASFVGFSVFTQFTLTQKIQYLDESLNIIKAQQLSWMNRSEGDPGINGELQNKKINQLLENVNENRQQLLSLSEHIATSAQSCESSLQAGRSTISKSVSNRDTKSKEEVKIPQNAAEVLDFGLLDEVALESLNDELSQMTKEENKAFWTEFYSRLDSGQLYFPES